MPADRFFIGPPTKGQQQNVKSWLIMDEAFEELRNAYTWRGTVRKRPGGRVMNATVGLDEQQTLTRLRLSIGTTDAMGNLGPVVVPGATFAVGQMFTCGTGANLEIYTVNTAGNPAATLTTGTGTATYSTVTGTFNLTGGPANTLVYFYPATPVMALDTYQTSIISDETLIAFDTQFAYEFTFATGWARIAAGTSTWTGTDSDFFSSENFRGATSNIFLFFVTNNVVADAMRYWNGATWTAFGSAGTTPIDAAGNFIETCRVIKVFKNRLLLFDVAENIGAVSTRFQNRVRFSQNGSPIAATAWREDTPGLGGFVDIPVKEAIVTVENIKDRLIVFCENSTWELVYTNNEILPFRFQQINTELGVESTNSIIPFDKEVIGFGSNGIHACNGINVERIDDQIPDEIFEVSNSNNGLERVAGIRDYFIEVVYWTYQATSNNTGSNNVYPNKVLMYNYKNNSWATLDDSITALGSFQLTQTLLWQNVQSSWDEFEGRWQDASLQNRFRSVIAGNQEGWTFILDSNKATNSIALQITDITIAGNTLTINAINHNLPDNSFVLFSNIEDTGNLGTLLNDNIFQINVLNANNFTVIVNTPAGVYSGGGSLTRVSRIFASTKQFNFYNKPGMEISLEHIDFYVDNSKPLDEEDMNFTPAEIQTQARVSSAEDTITEAAVLSSSEIGNYVLDLSPVVGVDYEVVQRRFWHSVYYNVTGELVQIIFLYSDLQMLDPEIVFNDFQLNSMIFYTRPTKQLG